MSSFLSEMERIIQENADRGLEVLLYYKGEELGLYRGQVRDDVYGRVHGKNSGNPVVLVTEFKGAIAGDDFFPTTGTQSGVFKKAWLFCERTIDIRPGDEIVVKREDNKRMAYRVEEKPSLGQTREVFTKWELSGIM